GILPAGTPGEWSRTVRRDPRERPARTPKKGTAGSAMRPLAPEDLRSALPTRQKLAHPHGLSSISPRLAAGTSLQTDNDLGRNEGRPVPGDGLASVPATRAAILSDMAVVVPLGGPMNHGRRDHAPVDVPVELPMFHADRDSTGGAS